MIIRKKTLIPLFLVLLLIRLGGGSTSGMYVSIYMSVYMCMYVYVYACISMWVYECMYLKVCIYKSIWMCVDLPCYEQGWEGRVTDDPRGGLA